MSKKRTPKAEAKATKARRAEIKKTDDFHAKAPIPVAIVPTPSASEVEVTPMPVPPGNVLASRSVDVVFNITSPATGVRVDLDQLGLGHDADSVLETSGNHRYLDAARPPVIEGGDLLVFFDPEMTSGNYGFSFAFTWNKELEPVMPKPLEDGKYAGVVETKPAKTRAAKAKKAKAKAKGKK